MPKRKHKNKNIGFDYDLCVQEGKNKKPVSCWGKQQTQLVGSIRAANGLRFSKLCTAWEPPFLGHPESAT